MFPIKPVRVRMHRRTVRGRLIVVRVHYRPSPHTRR